MKKSIKTYRKEVFWSDLASEFPNQTMKQAFQTEVKRCVALGLMEHPPENYMQPGEVEAFRAAFMKRRQK